MKTSYSRLAGALFCLSLLQVSHMALAEIELPDLPLLPDPDQIEELIPGKVLTDVDTVEAQVLPVVSAVSDHLRNIFRIFVMPDRRGGSAGDDNLSQGIWFHHNNSDFENTFSRTAFDGASELALAGYDLALGEHHLVGIAVGTETTEIDTAFNNGGMKTDGKTVVPYYGWLISDHWSLDLSMGLSDLDTNQSRVLPEGVGALSGTTVTSETSSKRTFAVINLNGFWTLGDFSLGARLGSLSSEIDQDGYAESDGTVVASGALEYKQSYIGADVAYGNRSQPFLGVTLLKDSSSENIVFPSGEQPSDDDDSLQFAAGWRYYGENGLSLILEWNKRDGKDDYLEDALSFTLRFDSD